METPPKILELVQTFDLHRDAYMAPGYNETQVRRQFIDPMFEAMGWDISNRNAYAEQYKQVVHEDSLQVGGTAKAPDYSFRLGGRRMFFVEAKKPAVNLKDDPSPAYQLRRYAWTAKLPVSILTDFEEFIVYDTRVKPEQDDKASKARVLHVPYTDYPQRWGEIAALFSPDAIQKGALDKFVQSTSKKRGTAEVDDAFLAEIEEWRELLAKNIALRNAGLGQRDLNFAVQITIDRIVFLRICEDRRIEPFAQLMALLNGDHVYDRLRVLFERADERYNSGLFHFHNEKGRDAAPDRLTPKLAIHDKVLKTIIRRLYYPDCPYEFSVFPPEILGQVYERFLGSVIRLTSGHQAKIEQKPEVRKAGGVYYTPSYIVDYIVKHTVGKLLEGKTPQQAGGLTEAWRPSKTARPLAVLDPACGSGSFLLGAYQFLLDWHLEQYAKEPDAHCKGKEPRIYQHHRGGWRLTTSERKRILLANIYGVDIDSQAVEVTKLSLLLKVLEGVDAEVLQRQLDLFHERALPDLDNNIKCGNSLIGPDFYKGKQGTFDEEEEYRINAFDWDKEFAGIMKAGGFDAVIGNPPYIRVRFYKDWYPVETAYLEASYKCAVHVWDIYLLFYERAIEVLRKGGLVSFIVPIQTLHQPNCESLRSLLIDETTLRAVVDLSAMKVFRDAIVKNCILVCERGHSDSAPIAVLQPKFPDDLFGQPLVFASINDVRANPGLSLKADLLSPKRALCEKLRKSSTELGEICYVTFGLRSCAKGVGQGGKDRLITDDPKSKHAKPYLEGREIQRYVIRGGGRYIKYIPSEMYSPRSPELFEPKKIVSQSMLSKMQLVATLDKESRYVEQSLVCIVPHGILTPASKEAPVSLEFLLGIVNSRIESFFFRTYVIDFSLGGGLVHATPGTQAKLIVPKSVGKSDVTRMEELVQRILDLHKRLRGAKAAHDRTVIERQIAATDEEIDHLVYELYGLTKDEIAIVEGASQ